MSGLPSPEMIAALTAVSLAQADGPLPPIATPVVVDHGGYAFGICPDDPGKGAFVHAGLRLGWVPMPVQKGLLLSLWGGLTPEHEFEDEGIVAFITRDGLRRLAADLLAIADASAAA